MKKRKWMIAALAAAAVSCFVGIGAMGVGAEELPVTESYFGFETGASVRKEEPAGLRFIVKMGEAEYNALVDENKAYKDGKTLKVYVAPQAYFEKMELSEVVKEAVSAEIDPETIRTEEGKEGSYFANAVLKNILYENHALNYQAVAAIEKDGAETEYSEVSDARSIAYVASAAKAKGETEAVLDTFVQKGIAAASGVAENEFDDGSYEIELTLDESLVLEESGEAALTLGIAPVDLYTEWASDNEEVAVVDENGKVTAVAEGTANITATVYGETATCKVTVRGKIEATYAAETDTITFAEEDGYTYKLLDTAGETLADYTSGAVVSDALGFGFRTDIAVLVAEYYNGVKVAQSDPISVTTAAGANELNGFDSAETTSSGTIVYSDTENFTGTSASWGWQPEYVDSVRYGNAGKAAKIVIKNQKTASLNENKTHMKIANKTGADWSGITSVSWYVYIDSASVKNAAGESTALPFDAERLLKGWWWYAGANIGTTSVTAEAADGGAVAADKWVKCTLNIDPAAYDFFFPTIDGQRMFRLYCWNCEGRLPEGGNWFSPSGYGFTFYLDGMTFSK